MSKNYASRIDKECKFSLEDFDHEAIKGLSKLDAAGSIEKLGEEMEELFDLMSFAGTHSLLIVLQGMDTSGKDGTIRHLLKFSHAQDCHVQSFKVPSTEERAHDFLWRVHPHAPKRGAISIFNRSHYEDIVVVRVHDIISKKVQAERAEHIKQFESLLADQSTVILKFFLNVSKEEQKERLLAREADVNKSWKLSVGDWTERELWGKYQAAYEDAIGMTAAKHAPWFIVPANQKWFRDLAVTQAVVEALKPYKSQWHDHLEEIGVKAKAELAAFRKSKV